MLHTQLLTITRFTHNTHQLPPSLSIKTHRIHSKSCKTYPSKNEFTSEQLSNLYLSRGVYMHSLTPNFTGGNYHEQDRHHFQYRCGRKDCRYSQIQVEELDGSILDAHSEDRDWQHPAQEVYGKGHPDNQTDRPVDERRTYIEIRRREIHQTVQGGINRNYRKEEKIGRKEKGVFAHPLITVNPNEKGYFL